ncbi:uncharacterized protein LOC117289968 [Asterias rubens]|uniref:Arnp15a n=1 Tax=Asterias rubens TaxID=7604 RepID=A0A0U2IWK8_ASTRU|nr:uncharacterized protein LOC117289968 [Asterias rubens]ALJ99977.1 Arnp15a [Asterias rubens]
MKSILCICAIALLVEVVIGAPFAEMAGDMSDEDSQLFSKRVRDIISPLSHDLDKRKANLCAMDCFSCFKMIRNVSPDQCVTGCQKKSISDGSYSYDRMWNRCSSYLTGRRR